MGKAGEGNAMKSKRSMLVNPGFLAVALLVLFLAAYWVPFRSMINTWWTNEDYSYGFLVPLISLYLLWDRREVFRKLAVGSSWVVFPILLVFYLLALYGILGSSGNIAMPAVPILVLLFTAFVFGLDTLRRLFLPLVFLIFMMPVPAVLERTIGVFLKSVSSKMGGALISLAGISVHVSGNIIDIGVTQLQVVDACSGLRYLFPLIALGLLYSYFFEKALWKQVLCVLATIPIAILMNALRIGITGVLANYLGVSTAEGFFHGFSGWLIFLAAFAGLFALGRFLRLFPPRKTPAGKKGTVGKYIASTPGKGSVGKAFLTSVVLLIITASLSFSTSSLPAIKIRGGLSSFPLSFNDWKGRSQPIDPEIIAASGAEDSFGGSYRNSKNDDVSLYIGYRSTAFLETENFFHSPTVCLPSSGWQEISTGIRILPGVPAFGSLPVTEMIMENMGTKHLVYFWFQTKSRATEDKNVNRFHLSLHALTRDNTHALFIRPILAIKPGESLDEARGRMDQFVRDMMDALLRFLKENQYEEKA
jgi:exosortase D (VPLPA-CTERM-specific)